jgi:hypothetical protein
MPKGPLKPKVSEIRRTIRAVRREGEQAERVVVDFQTGNFTVVIARGDKPPRPEIDLLREVEDMLATDGEKPSGAVA